MMQDESCVRDAHCLLNTDLMNDMIKLYKYRLLLWLSEETYADIKEHREGLCFGRHPG